MRNASRNLLFHLSAVLLLAMLRPLDAAAADSQFPFGCPVREGFVKVTGGRVWYQVVGDGDAVPLIVIHGGPGFPHDYLEPIGALCRERPVVFYDQLGAGKSERPHDKSLWRIERFVKELGQLRKQLSLKRTHILGQSWGTMLLTDYALTQPDGVVSLIFSDPLCSVSEFLRDADTYLKELPAATLDTIKRHESEGYTGCLEYQAAVLEYYKLHVCRLAVWPDSLERAFAGHNDEIYEAMQGLNEFTFTGNLKDWERTERLKEIKVPALYLAGRYDETSPRATNLCHEALPGSEMVVFEKSAHTPYLEETELYLKTVSDFLRRTETAALQGAD